MGAPLRPGAPRRGTASGAADDTEAHVWGRLRRASGLVGPGRASVGLRPTGGASRRLPPTGQEDVGEVAAEGRGARGGPAAPATIGPAIWPRPSAGPSGLRTATTVPVCVLGLTAHRPRQSPHGSHCDWFTFEVNVSLAHTSSPGVNFGSRLRVRPNCRELRCSSPAPAVPGQEEGSSPDTTWTSPAPHPYLPHPLSCQDLGQGGLAPPWHR